MDVLLKALNADSLAAKGLSEEEQALALRARVLALANAAGAAKVGASSEVPPSQPASAAQPTAASSRPAATAAQPVATPSAANSASSQAAALRSQAATLAAEVAKLDALADSYAAQAAQATMVAEQSAPKTIERSAARPADPILLAVLKAEVIELAEQVECLKRERAELAHRVETLTAERDYLRQIHSAVLAFAQRLIG